MGACDAAAVVQHVFVCRSRNQCTPNDVAEQVGTTQDAAHSCTSMYVMPTTCAMALIYNSVRTASRFVGMSAELCTFSDKKCVVTVVKASY